MATEVITNMLYNNTVKVDFLPNSHRYKINGQSMKFSMSKVSGIIDKPFLLNWACGCMADELINKLPNGITKEDILTAKGASNRIKDQAAGIGTHVDDFCEAFSLFSMGKADKPTIPQFPDLTQEENNAIVNGCNGFLEWANEHNVKFLEAERFVYSKKFHIVGQLDTICLIDGKKYLGDYKTSKAFYEMENGMQTVGYQIAYEEETEEKIDGRMIIRFDKETGSFHIHYLNDYTGDRQNFIAGLTLVRKKIEVEEKKAAAIKAAKEAARAAE